MSFFPPMLYYTLNCPGAHKVTTPGQDHARLCQFPAGTVRDAGEAPSCGGCGRGSPGGPLRGRAAGQRGDRRPEGKGRRSRPTSRRRLCQPGTAGATGARRRAAGAGNPSGEGGGGGGGEDPAGPRAGRDHPPPLPAREREARRARERPGRERGSGGQQVELKSSGPSGTRGSLPSPRLEAEASQQVVWGTSGCKHVLPELSPSPAPRSRLLTGPGRKAPSGRARGLRGAGRAGPGGGGAVLGAGPGDAEVATAAAGARGAAGGERGGSRAAAPRALSAHHPLG